MAVQQARVPVLGSDGRFPDAYAPPSVAANTAAAQEAREGAETARTGAITAQGKAEDAQRGAEDALAGVPGAVEGTLAPQVQAATDAAEAAQGSAEAAAQTADSRIAAGLASGGVIKAADDATLSAAKSYADSGVAQVSTWFLRGNGSPVGIITPTSAGVQYVDLAATNGARIWISTGTTNSSWRVVDGDTGNRNIAALLVNGWTATSVIVSRFASSAIDLRIVGLSGSAATSQTVLTLPSGFTSGNSFSLLLRDGLTLRTLSIAYNGVATAPLATVSADASGVFKNPSQWPTTLPGTPA